MSGQPAPPSLVAGTDISFFKDSTLAVAAVVLCSLPDLQPVWLRAQLCSLDAAYVPGELAKREAAPLLSIFDLLKEDLASPAPVVGGGDTKKGKRDIAAALSLPPTENKAGRGWLWTQEGAKLTWPSCILVDGSGILHHTKAGLAVHIGTALKTPAIGVAKNLLAVHGLEKKSFESEWAAMMSTFSEDEKKKAVGQRLDLKASTPGSHCGSEVVQKPSAAAAVIGSLPAEGEVLGRALRTNPAAFNPIFVSLGFAGGDGEGDDANSLSLDSACDLVLRCCSGLATIPVPIALADHWSRFAVSKHPEPAGVPERFEGTASAGAGAGSGSSDGDGSEGL